MAPAWMRAYGLLLRWKPPATTSRPHSSEMPAWTRSSLRWCGTGRSTVSGPCGPRTAWGCPWWSASQSSTPRAAGGARRGSAVARQSGRSRGTSRAARGGTLRPSACTTPSCRWCWTACGQCAKVGRDPSGLIQTTARSRCLIGNMTCWRPSAFCSRPSSGRLRLAAPCLAAAAVSALKSSRASACGARSTTVACAPALPVWGLSPGTALLVPMSVPSSSLELELAVSLLPMSARSEATLSSSLRRRTQSGAAGINSEIPLRSSKATRPPTLSIWNGPIT
mmetsp:Transcript_10739/g.30418  ORF Transcript_10739/g.30418 Transcript_10739/m.30418 type:complete len:280 (+) Transcript_10739:1027-1866(+)